mmetsp:Transcript_45484/g.114453  ORF Transcript_45484/g.114453 Transcript_45484/m.114453 type:complete len:267 (+) Transcript_45484:222-1022(+)
MLELKTEPVSSPYTSSGDDEVSLPEDYFSADSKKLPLTRRFCLRDSPYEKPTGVAKLEERRQKKLARNRVAAKKSRQRKKEYITELESRITDLMEAQNALLIRMTNLESENRKLRFLLEGGTSFGTPTVAPATAGTESDLPKACCEHLRSDDADLHDGDKAASIPVAESAVGTGPHVERALSDLVESGTTTENSPSVSSESDLCLDVDSELVGAPIGGLTHESWTTDSVLPDLSLSNSLTFSTFDALPELYDPVDSHFMSGFEVCS